MAFLVGFGVVNEKNSRFIS